MCNQENFYANAFNHLPGLGAQRLKLISSHFKLMSDAWQCQDLSEFRKAGLPDRIIRRIFAVRNSLDLNHLAAELERNNIRCVNINEKAYPTLLRQIHNPPFLIYLRGNLDIKDCLAVAVVGTRKCTNYGIQVTEKIVSELAVNKITVVSGLALGIDTIAHKSALENNGQTIAVLGGSVVKNEIYPRINSILAEKIVSQGALISEYPPGAFSLKQNFPVRNRLISGLCQGTIVIEAGRRSGALITAFLALEQNREVMAVPGNITSPMSAGTNMLITKGAALIRQSKDIFEALNVKEPNIIQETRKILPETRTERIILGLLDSEPKHLDKIVSLTKFDVNVISSTLSIMELKGLVRSTNGGRYIKL